MEWSIDSLGWRDLDASNGDYMEPIASFQTVDHGGNFIEIDDPDARWVIIWHYTNEEEYLDPTEYTEAQVRNHIVLKYKLLRGER